ncbi:MAG TPA: hypothetical protein VHX44_14440 [Planctomycetota bacterium]|nr:hypothetical protein [Planctomycetota bacterium]
MPRVSGFREFVRIVGLAVLTCSFVGASLPALEVGSWADQVHHDMVKINMTVADLQGIDAAYVIAVDPANRFPSIGGHDFPPSVMKIIGLGAPLLHAPREEAWTALRRSLQSPWAEVRYLSVVYLHALDPDRVGSLLLPWFSQEPEEAVRIRMIRTFGATVYDPALALMCDHLSDPHEPLTGAVEAALVAFSGNGRRALVESLPRAASEEIRVNRLRFLRRQDENEHLEALVRYVSDASATDALRTAACEALKEARYLHAIRALIPILAEPRIRFTNLCLAIKDTLQEMGSHGTLALAEALPTALSADHRANLL